MFDTHGYHLVVAELIPRGAAARSRSQRPPWEGPRKTRGCVGEKSGKYRNFYKKKPEIDLEKIKKVDFGGNFGKFGGFRWNPWGIFGVFIVDSLFLLISIGFY